MTIILHNTEHTMQGINHSNFDIEKIFHFIHLKAWDFLHC